MFIINISENPLIGKISKIIVKNRRKFLRCEVFMVSGAYPGFLKGVHILFWKNL